MIQGFLWWGGATRQDAIIRKNTVVKDTYTYHDVKAWGHTASSFSIFGTKLNQKLYYARQTSCIMVVVNECIKKHVTQSIFR